MFDDNPCRRHPFEVFQVDKTDTNRRSILTKVDSALELWRHEQGKVTGPDGVPYYIDEAHLNALKAQLDEPLARLKAEQFAHQEHPFSEDAELTAALESVQLFPPSELEAGDTRAAVTAVLGPLMPEVEHRDLPDDLPQPARPEPFPIESEPWHRVILRDC